MKNLLLSIFFFICLFSEAQLTDTTCIKTRWISVKQNDDNKELFSNLEDGSNILFFIKKLVESNIMNIYDEDNSYIRKGEWYRIPNVKYEVNPQSKDTLYTDSISGRFKIYHESTSPLINVYGEDSTIMYDGSTILAVYPPKKYYYINIDEIDEIRIKESRVFDKKIDEFKFIPTGLSFSMNHDGYRKELFWVDLNDLLPLLESKGYIKWMEFVKNKKYIGFQYLQSSCYDDKIRY
jgi:hypothetical protein